jgi:hypothetical protein
MYQHFCLGSVIRIKLDLSQNNPGDFVLRTQNEEMLKELSAANCTVFTFDTRRTSWIRASSCGVVTEPSTSETSYGPFAIALEASGKYAMSTAFAMLRSSSSQSKMLNWHPSHEANFQTASFGLRFPDTLRSLLFRRMV